MISLAAVGCQSSGDAKRHGLTDVLSEKEVQQRAMRDPFPRADEQVGGSRGPMIATGSQRAVY